MKKIGNDSFTAAKDRKKVLSVIFQWLIIAGVTAFCVNALFTLTTYKALGVQNSIGSSDKGFIALSYFGVARESDEELIGVGLLHDHLQALKDRGYVTVTQDDVFQYYESGKSLPEKSLLLLFEDGRRDTAIFSQKILEKLNYKATMVTYAGNFSSKDTKFLQPHELQQLEKTSYWEMGTNGYRLSFINVFDRYNNYLGDLNPLQFSSVAPFVKHKYNHYLMDYIRDEHGIPRESYEGMKARISYDYETLRDRYKSSLGYIPALHVLMHANTGSFGNHDKVSAVNGYWIKELFRMNFNREGFCLNQRNSSLYDLTRMQPQPYWQTNHLLMRIQYDTGEDIGFVTGDAQKHEAWETLKGALEVKGEKLILTSLPLDKGLVRLKNSNDFKDVKVTVKLTGNKLGLQKIYLRADEKLSRFIALSVFNNYLYVTEKSGGREQELFTLDLDRHDGKPVLSIPEHKKEAVVRELETFARYADTVQQSQVYGERLKDKLLEDPLSVAAGAPEYVPDLSVHAAGDRLLALSLAGNKLTVAIDNKETVHDLAVRASQSGAVYLETAWGNFGWSQRNIVDDVYDGVYEQLTITENTGAKKEKVLFDSKFKGLEAFGATVKKGWEGIVNWFVRNL